VAITDIKVRNAQPKDKKYKIADGDNLYLQISPRVLNHGSSDIKVRK
jgi:hypothetical protein